MSAFWKKNGFNEIKSGRKTDQASGAGSSLVIKSLSSTADSWVDKAVNFFTELTSNSNFTKEDLPSAFREILYRFAYAHGSVESATLIAQKIPALPKAGPTLLSKREIKQFRNQVASWLEDHPTG